MKFTKAAVTGVLMQFWDPIGISDVPECLDEYDRYAELLIDLIARGSSDTEVAHALYSIERVEMGHTTFRFEHLCDVAAKARAAYERAIV